ncbi:amidohydrolase family protein [Agaribacterium sp. ZY112]|uniref:amidohydrolase family protein n=1 Tax=Agaribacterium sp. ZY112 TaxID=3233574 RepID=UPI0035252AA1
MKFLRLSYTFLIYVFFCLNTQAHAQRIAINNIQLIDSNNNGALGPQNILLENGYIKAISKQAFKAEKVINGEGKYLIPGLIDSHVHLEGIPGMKDEHINKHPAIAEQAKAQIPRSYLYFGFTTVLDLLANKKSIDEWNKQALRPDAYFCLAAPIANGYPLSWLPRHERFNSDMAPYIVYDEKQKDTIPKHINAKDNSPSAVVKKIKQAGAQCVKTFYEEGFGGQSNLPNPSKAMMQELISSAHQYAMPVFVHGNSQASQIFAVNAGADVIAHGMWRWGNKSTLKPSPKILKLIDQIAEQQIGYQATIQVIYGEQELFNDAYFDMPSLAHAMPKELSRWYQSSEGRWMRSVMAKNMGLKLSDVRYQDLKEEYSAPIKRASVVVQQLAQHDARLLFGSDTPSGPFYTQFPGLNGYLEIQRLAEAGVPLPAILHALTLANAKALGLEEQLGSIDVGKRANLLVLNDNPLTSAQAYNSIETVILHGEVHQRHTLSAKNINL